MKPYKSWSELLHRWCLGETDIRPSRKHWAYRVVDDLLMFSEKITKEDGSVLNRQQVVGLPGNGAVPRLFFYLVCHWRGDARDRPEIEGMGGVPVMPFEVSYLLGQMDRLDLLPREDCHDSDWAALEYIQEWADAKGMLNTSISWRDHIIDMEEPKIFLRKLFRGNVRKTLVAEFQDDGNLHLLAQSRRSASTAWVKDAVYTALSRARGRGLKAKLIRLGTAGVGKLQLSGGEISIADTPDILCDRLKPQMT